MKTRKKDNPRREAKKLARKIRNWISRSLAGAVCPACGDTLGRDACACGGCALNPADFEVAEEEV